MSIRIWHQSFTVLGELTPYRQALEEHFRTVSRADTEIVMHGMRPRTYRSNYPGDDIKYCAFQYLHGLQFMQAARAAEKGGFDAFALSTLPEPALREIQTLVEIPVVGYLEAALESASKAGSKIGVLVFISELAELTAANIRQHGYENNFVVASHVGFTFHDVLPAFDDPEPLLERFFASARKMIKTGADVIIPGEAPLNVILARNGISEVDGVPIIDSLAAWIQRAERLVDAHRDGQSMQPGGYFSTRPPKDRIDELFRFYGLS
ncbi:racemase [Hyphomonas adhaerens MHS-3]|uniref:Racemase n=1 Tax=Hyphomonas adhaerens MHS-3 TaxID=1280949 RepID=A0A069E7H6_9PROT|nr:aspartate/glutamate racemase family protein [Hyphomonas adhaerens]KCZ86022.1 racemase [Hyphomonas adhaerens MHS-3]